MSAARGPDQSVFDDLSSRFILNCPPEELSSFERIMFLIEQAHWFYEDTLRHEKKLRWWESGISDVSMCVLLFSWAIRVESCRSIPVLKEFAFLMFNHTSILRPYVNQFDHLYKRFNAYKLTVPVYGAIVLNVERSKVSSRRLATFASRFGVLFSRLCVVYAAGADGQSIQEQVLGFSKGKSQQGRPALVINKER